jgi:hypothetical protein
MMLPSVTISSLRSGEIDGATDPVFENWSNGYLAGFDWLDLRTLTGTLPGPDADGVLTWYGALHPSSLTSDRLRAIVEYRVDGNDPLIEVVWGDGVAVPQRSAAPVNLGDGWFRATFSVVRNPDRSAIGHTLDQFVYRARQVEVRLFEIHDAGPLGDANMNRAVDGNDLGVVAANYGISGDTDFEEGDTNLDRVVDAQDALIVIDALNNP